MKKRLAMIIAALALLAFITIYRPAIEYLFPDMPDNYAILLRKGLQALTVVAYITVMKLWKQIGTIPDTQKPFTQQKGSCLTAKQPLKGLFVLLPVVILSFSPYFFGFKAYSFKEIIITIIICLLIGVIEELSLRGIMYNALRPYGAPTAVIISSAVFALVHIPNMFYNKDAEATLYQVAFAFGFGLIMAYIRHKTGLLLPQLLVHALWDFNVKISETSLTIPLADTINYISEISVVLLGLWLMILVIKQSRHKKKNSAVLYETSAV